MYKLKNTLILLAVLCLTVSSCSKDNEAPSTKSIIQQGKWRITLFNDNGTNETTDYSGYQFTFNPDGQVVAVKNNVTVTGTWSVGADESRNRLILNFTTIALAGLNKEWSFNTKSYTVVELESVSNTNGTDTLILEKI